MEDIVLQSDKNVNLKETTYDTQKGRSRVLNLSKNPHITVINIRDNLCVPRVIVTTISYYSKNFLGYQLTQANIAAIELIRRLGGDYDNNFTLEDIKQAK